MNVEREEEDGLYLLARHRNDTRGEMRVRHHGDVSRTEIYDEIVIWLDSAHRNEQVSALGR